MAGFEHIVSAIDAHTAGEPTRIVLSGLPAIKGHTMAEKKHWMQQQLDHFRTLLIHEPRGHGDMFGVVLTPPVSEYAHYGVLFMDNAGYIDMCGHGLMATTTVLIETGMIAPVVPETTVIFDTPAGLVKSHALVEGGRVVKVSIANVPSFLYAKDYELDLPEIGRISIDIAFGGNFFAMVPAQQLNISVHPNNLATLIQLALQVKSTINDKLDVYHPSASHITAVELVEIYEKSIPSALYSKSIVVFGNGQVDRCPCGTGTSAAMATLHAHGELPLNTVFTNEGIIGTQFKGKLVKERQIGDFLAVDPIVTGEAYITGIQQFVVDPSDPLKHGFVIAR